MIDSIGFFSATTTFDLNSHKRISKMNILCIYFCIIDYFCIFIHGYKVFLNFFEFLCKNV